MNTSALITLYRSVESQLPLTEQTEEAYVGAFVEAFKCNPVLMSYSRYFSRYYFKPGDEKANEFAVASLYAVNPDKEIRDTLWKRFYISKNYAVSRFVLYLWDALMYMQASTERAEKFMNFNGSVAKITVGDLEEILNDSNLMKELTPVCEALCSAQTRTAFEKAGFKDIVLIEKILPNLVVLREEIALSFKGYGRIAIPSKKTNGEEAERDRKLLLLCLGFRMAAIIFQLILKARTNAQWAERLTNFCRKNEGSMARLRKRYNFNAEDALHTVDSRENLVQDGLNAFYSLIL